MKAIIPTSLLLQTLQRIQNVTEKKAHMPILSHLLLEASNEQTLEFFATDLELSVHTKIAAQVEEPGKTTVSARKLLDVVREVYQSDIMLEITPNHRLTVLAGRSRFDLATIPWEDFPNVSFYEDTPYVPCPTSLLVKALEKTMYAIPAEDDVFSVGGLYLQPVGSETLRFVASDGHRLVYYNIAKDSLLRFEIEDGIIIPRKGVKEILRLLENEEGEVLWGIYANCLMLKTENTLLSIQLLEDRFPEYEMIIPEERAFSFTVEWESFYHALKRVAAITDQRWRHVRFTIRENSLELAAGSQEIGSANDFLDIDYRGEDFFIAFDIRYVLDAIQPMESKEVRFEWVDTEHGGVFLAPDDPDYFSLVMPMVV